MTYKIRPNLTGFLNLSGFIDQNVGARNGFLKPNLTGFFKPDRFQRDWRRATVSLARFSISATSTGFDSR
jgi:hypothetical protein